MIARAAIALVAAMAAGACTRAAPPRNLGGVMSDVARRFEELGKAAAAHRWDLATYYANELGEAVEEIPGATPPPRDEIGDVELPAMAHALDAPLAQLAPALATHDDATVGRAYAAVAAVCNACHTAARHAFIEVPTRPGEPVPHI